MRVLFILLTLSTTLAAQDRQNVFTLKPAVGANGCQVHGDNYSGYDKFGIFLGAAVNARINVRGSFELGFYFSQKGSRKNPDPKNGDYTLYWLNLNYIDLPLSWRFHLNEKYFITLGPSLAYLISYREETEIANWTGMYPFNKFEAGVNFGLGGKIKDRITVELRSSNSVTPIRSFGILANRVWYPNPVARFFNRGLYSNLLTLFIAYQLDFRNHG